MWNIVLNILSEFLLIILASAYILFTNRADLLKKLGYKKTYMDIPYDPENNLILLVKARLHDYKDGIYILPQTSKTGATREDSSLINAEELGLKRHLYNPKIPFKYTGKSDNSKKSYQICYVRISKSEIINAAKEKQIPWTYNEDNGVFMIGSVEYTEARFETPEKALELLIKNSHLGTRPNVERAKVYSESFKKLGEIFDLRHSSQSF